MVVILLGAIGGWLAFEYAPGATSNSDIERTARHDHNTPDRVDFRPDTNASDADTTKSNTPDSPAPSTDNSPPANTSDPLPPISPDPPLGHPRPPMMGEGDADVPPAQQVPDLSAELELVHRHGALHGREMQRAGR